MNEYREDGIEICKHYPCISEIPRMAQFDLKQDFYLEEKDIENFEIKQNFSDPTVTRTRTVHYHCATETYN
jgi:hypothetical protein